jgi:hypothetical protein
MSFEPFLITVGFSIIPAQNKGLFFSGVILIVSFSFYFYAPCFFAWFNSDHAIHVLMSQDFTWPRDVYFWGQNRLGSFMPMVSHALIKLIPVHPLYICSAVQYLFLLVSAFIISGILENIWLKLAVFIFIFIPVNEYNALLYLGHPYASGLFCGVLFLLFSTTFINQIRSAENKPKRNLKLWSSLIAAQLFFFLSIWISEFNALLLIISGILFFKRKQLHGSYDRKFIFQLLTEIALFLVLTIYGYKKFKSFAPGDAEYGKIFITSINSIVKQFNFLSGKIADTWLFRDGKIIENLFYYLLLLFIITLLIIGKKGRDSNKWMSPLAVFAIAGAITLFFSSWNLRSEYSPRYHIPVYIAAAIFFLLFFDSKYNRNIAALFTILLFVVSVTFCYLTLIRHERRTPFERYGEFANLPRGTLIAGYWETYVICSVACYNLQPLPFQEQTVRNWEWRDKLLSEKNFYFIDTPDFQEYGTRDSIKQFDTNFIFTGKTYYCNNIPVLLYRKANRAQ